MVAMGQDSTFMYLGWGKPGSAIKTPLDSLSGENYSKVVYLDDKPVQIDRYRADGTIERSIENTYDDYGNHLSRKSFDDQRQLREEMLFRNNPDEIALFRKVFGSTFSPANSNFTIYREYNEFGRELAYHIMGVHGSLIYSRTTLYREDRRKDKEILMDNLNDRLLAERKYKYDDKEKRTILEEFNGEGKLVQRVVLFDQHDILEE
jgi:hypothetical protein